MKTVIEMAKEAGFDLGGMANMLYTVRGNHAQLERLVALARADEREACAKYLNDQNTAITDKLAAEIRARSNT